MDSSRVLLEDPDKESGPLTRRSVSHEPTAGMRARPHGKAKLHPPPAINVIGVNRVLDRSSGLAAALDEELEAVLGATEAQHRLRALREDQKAATAIEIERRDARQARKSAK